VNVAEKCGSQAVSMTKVDLITVIADKLKFPWGRSFDCQRRRLQPRSMLASVRLPGKTDRAPRRRGRAARTRGAEGESK
jgi:hypothetical protein